MWSSPRSAHTGRCARFLLAKLRTSEAPPILAYLLGR